VPLVVRLVAIAAALSAPWLAAPVRAQDATLEELAGLYRQGYRDDALAEIDLWPADRTLWEVDRLLRRRPFDAALAYSAALLHVNRALLASSATLEYRHRHLSAANRLLLAAADAPVSRGSAGMARRMFLLVGLALEDVLEVREAHDTARAGLERFEDDADLLTLLGTTLENGPSMRTYDQPLEPRRRSPAGRTGFSIEGSGSRGEWRELPESSLASAEWAFRRALEADPGLGEARLRLGRVRVLQGRPAEAIADLQQVARVDGSLRRRYLARLFEGRAQEKRGDIQAAARAYRDAVAIEPEGQSAWIGLGRALDILGRADEAQEALAAALGTGRQRGDPWWSYPRGDTESLEPLVAEMQEALAR
jgi:tetratricopeptide (TPR) repeat protein